MRFADLRSLVKSGVLIVNVLPVFTGFWLALYFTNQSLSSYWDVCLLTIIGSTVVMAGALIFNNWYDRDIDKVMARTKNRPTVTGRISPNTVFVLGIACSILGLLILLFFTTVETTIYAFIGWFTYVVLYTMWSKRRYTINTLIGSISGAVSPLMGWSAVASSFHVIPAVLFLVLFIWQMPHAYTTYMKNYNDYKAARVAMLPVIRGFAVTKRHIVVYIVCLLPLPFFLQPLGTSFVVICTLLNVAWLVISIRGLFKENDHKWVRTMFIYSVNYITVLFLLMVVVTLPLF